MDEIVKNAELAIRALRTLTVPATENNVDMLHDIRYMLLNIIGIAEAKKLETEAANAETN